LRKKKRIPIQKGLAFLANRISKGFFVVREEGSLASKVFVGSLLFENDDAINHK